MHSLFQRDFGEAFLAYRPPNSSLIGSGFFHSTITVTSCINMALPTPSKRDIVRTHMGANPNKMQLFR